MTSHGLASIKEDSVTNAGAHVEGRNHIWRQEARGWYETSILAFITTFLKN